MDPSQSGICGNVVLTIPSDSAQCPVVNGEARRWRFALSGVRLYRAILVLAVLYISGPSYLVWHAPLSHFLFRRKVGIRVSPIDKEMQPESGRCG